MPLPDLISLENFNGDVEKYLDHLYEVFCTEIANAGLTFLGKRIACAWHPPHKDKHFGFWHLVSTGGNEDERVIDLRRCESIRYIPYILNIAHAKDRVDCWLNSRYGNTHTVLLSKETPYTVILSERETCYVLKSGYPLDKPHNIRKMLAEKAKSSDPR